MGAVAGVMAFCGSAIAAAPTQSRMQAAHASALSATRSNWRKNPDIKVDPKVPRTFSAGSGARADLLVRFKGEADLSAAFAMNWHDRGEYVYRTLKKFADHSQADALQYFRSHGIKYRQLWIANAVALHQADEQTFNALMTLRNVRSISVQRKIDLPLPPRISPQNAGTPGLNSINEDLSHIHVPDVWGMGFKGAGTVVANIDAGVRYTHEALVNAYRGNNGGSFDHDYNWYDPYDGTAVPRTSDAHGSHTMGIMVGDNGSDHQMGMAPEAKWIACIGFGDSGGAATDAGLLACGQFMVAPTKTDGTAPDPEMRPDVVNNSWGDCQTTFDDWYESTVDAWVASGIVPVFSNGNNSNCGFPTPPGLGTVNNPGRYGKVLGIGATGNHDGAYASYSNWGPTDNVNPGLPGYPDPMGYDTLKPNVAAPGTQVLSSGNSSDSAYLTESGTSMAAPHVAGLVALMENAAPCLLGDYATIGTIIMQTANGIPYMSGGPDDDPTDHVPNEATGWGEIDALAAVNAAIASCGPQGTIAGTVTDAGTSNPIADAAVEIHNGSYDFNVTTDSNGDYSQLVPVGTYDIDVSAFAYEPAQQAGVNVTEDVTTTADFALVASPTYTISGVVTDANTGWPLHASVAVTGAPIDPVWTDPVTGAYSVTLPAGDYTLTASATADGYKDGMATVSGLSSNMTEDLMLDVQGTCTAPGYAPASPLVNEDFEGGSLPAGWSRSSNGVGWQIGSDLGSSFFAIPSHSVYAASNDDAAGFGNDGSVDMLTMPALDLSSASNPLLRFDSFFTGDYGQAAYVEVSTDGGANWAPVGSVDTNAASWISQSIDLADFAGMANVMVRFHADDTGSFATGWAVDNVEASPGCIVPAGGGLAVGKVTDANTGNGVNGASVSTDPGNATTASAHVGDPAIGDGFYTVYAPEGSVQVTASKVPYNDATATATVPHYAAVRADLSLASGQLVLDPVTGPEATLDFGTGASSTLDVQNIGSADANFIFLAAVLSNDFEGQLTDNGWSVTNNGGDCVWMRNDAWGDANLAGGDGYSADANSDTCGSGTMMDTSLVSPQFSLAGATSQARLGFVVSYQNLGSSDFLDVDISIDNGATWSNLTHFDSDVSPSGPGQQVSLDLSDWLGAAHARVRFHYVAGWAWHAQVDQVRMYSNPNTVPWFALNPSDGMVAQGSSKSLNALFDASSVTQPGDYMTPLKLFSDTPYSPQDSMAVMHATVPSSFGTLQGTVSTQGYCGANPAALTGATVTILGSGSPHQVVTDASGNYSYQLDSAEAPFTILAMAPGQVQTSQSGVTLSAGGTTTTDLDMRLDAPCFQYSPQEVAMSADAGDSSTAQLSMMNLGVHALDSWTMSVGGDPTASTAVTLSQNDSDTITDANSIACYNSGSDLTRQDHWLRRFDLAQAGFAGDVTLNSMTFGVEALNNASSFDVEARVYVLPAGADFTFANLDQCRQQDGDCYLGRCPGYGDRHFRQSVDGARRCHSGAGSVCPRW